MPKKQEPEGQPPKKRKAKAVAAAAEEPKKERADKGIRRGSIQLSEEFITEICKLVEAGGSFPIPAAEYLGVSKSTFSRWTQIGKEEALQAEADEEAGREPKPATDYRELWERLTRACARLEVNQSIILSSQINAKDPKTGEYLMDAKTRMLFMGRRFKDNWGSKKVEISGPDNGPIESRIIASGLTDAQIEMLSPEELDTLIRAKELEERLASVASQG